jgi:hypothetical protein
MNTPAFPLSERVDGGLSPPVEADAQASSAATMTSIGSTAWWLIAAVTLLHFALAAVLPLSPQ